MFMFSVTSVFSGHFFASLPTWRL